jgi:hypothetical protein
VVGWAFWCRVHVHIDHVSLMEQVLLVTHS